MLIVKEIADILNDGRFLQRRDLRLPSGSDRDSEVFISLEDTETGERTEFYSSSYDELNTRLRRLRPYGFADRIADSDGEYVYNELVVVDELSLKFLEYVEVVGYLQHWVGYHSFGDYIFHPLDENKSLFMCVFRNEEVPCTLFQAICFVRNSIVDGKVLLNGAEALTSEDEAHMTNEEILEYNSDVKYMIRFSDEASAMRMITKYRTVGGNPLNNAFGEY